MEYSRGTARAFSTLLRLIYSLSIRPAPGMYSTRLSPTRSCGEMNFRAPWNLVARPPALPAWGLARAAVLRAWKKLKWYAELGGGGPQSSPRSNWKPPGRPDDPSSRGHSPRARGDF